MISTRRVSLAAEEIRTLFEELKPQQAALESFIYQTTNSLGIPGDGNLSIAMSRSYERTAKEELAKLELLEAEPAGVHVVGAAVRPVPSFQALTTNDQLRTHLESLWEEAVTAHDGHAYLSTVVMLGSLLEGALLAKCLENDAIAMASAHAPKAKGVTKPFSQWSLNDFIEVADDNQWIHKTRNDFADTLREYRNMVHPLNAYTRGYRLDKALASICWEVVKAALGDLGVSV
ncbi:MAG: hypothetical protein KGN02_14080 [bacterium]|nr:hypothetical protein [bacterium]